MSLTKAIMENTGKRFNAPMYNDVLNLGQRYEATNDLPINFTVKCIRMVHVPFLEASFLLRKHEYQIRFGSCQTEILFHATLEPNVSSILRTNLNWRKNNTKYKRGTGISFTRDALYAHVSSWGFDTKKTMIVTEVLMGRTVLAIDNKKNISKNNDTTCSGDGKNYVKYRDDEFLPKYLINYIGPVIPRAKRIYHNSSFLDGVAKI